MLMALFQRFWRWLTVISRTKRLMMDVSSSVGEVVMLGAGSIEHRELIYYTVSKSTTFEPPRSGLGGEPVRISSMVLLVAYAFYYKNVFSTVIYHHMPRERRCLRHPGAQQ